MVIWRWFSGAGFLAGLAPIAVFDTNIKAAWLAGA
jgi:hypothetical protein